MYLFSCTLNIRSRGIDAQVSNIGQLHVPRGIVIVVFVIVRRVIVVILVVVLHVIIHNFYTKKNNIH